MEKWIVDGTEYEDSNEAANAITELMICWMRFMDM